jgi:WD40 repeat protein
MLWIGLLDGLISLDSESAGVLNIIADPFSGWEGARFSTNTKVMGLWKKGKIEEFNLVDYSLIESYEYPAEAFLSPDYRLYAYISEDEQIHIADTRTRKVLHAIRKPSTLQEIIFSPNGEKVALVKAGEYMEIADIWELSTGRLITTLDFPPTATYAHSWHLEFSPDGKRVALAAEGIEYGGAILVYDLTTNTLLEQFEFAGRGLFSFSSDGSKIVVECPGDLPGLRCAYNLKTKEWMMSFRYQWGEEEGLSPEKLSSVSLSPGDQFLVCGTNKGRLLVWDAQNGDLLFELKGHNRGNKSISFSPDGRTFASTSYDGTVVVWDLDELNR